MLKAPTPDTLGIDPDERVWRVDCLGAAGNLDGPWVEAFPGCDAIDHDCRLTCAHHIAELLGLFYIASSRVDRSERRVVVPA